MSIIIFKHKLKPNCIPLNCLPGKSAAATACGVVDHQAVLDRLGLRGAAAAAADGGPAQARARHPLARGRRPDGLGAAVAGRDNEQNLHKIHFRLKTD